ncbi:Thioredoxin domain [Dillenia turbinata]|uniref:Thioredoxin domain n=1 Tax=Dillenia turbinata TaxID=194707 RepID=A0AAN8USW0_9MAGN
MPSDPSNIFLIKSEDQFNSTITKVQGESLPAIFYFTAVWCGPCKFISPSIIELSKKYPHVTTYKIDIDQTGKSGHDLLVTVSHAILATNCTVSSQCMITEDCSDNDPTLHFYKNGRKAAEVVGADVDRLKSTMESLYK